MKQSNPPAGIRGNFEIEALSLSKIGLWQTTVINRDVM